MRILTAALAAMATCAGGAASAAVLTCDISVPTTGNPNPAFLSLTLDTDQLVEGTGQTAGMTVNSSNFDVDGGVLYRLPFGAGNILIYGGVNGASAETNSNDFTIRIDDFASPDEASLGPVLLIQDDQGIIAISETGNTLDVTSGGTAVIPLPATLPLLAAGLAALGVWRRRA